MRSIKDDMYDEAFRLWDMVPAGTVPGYGSAGSVYRFANGCGHGEYWAYFHDNLFAVNAFDMTFEHAGVMRYRHAEHLSIGYYEAADLIVQSGGSTPSTWRSTSQDRPPERPPSPSRPTTIATICRPASGTSPTCAAPSRW